jgi:hypothetical protein
MEEVVTLPLMQLLQLLVMAASVGGLFMQIRTNTKAIELNKEAIDKKADKTEVEAQTKRIDTIEERFVEAVEKMTNKLSEVADEIKTALGRHDVEITLQGREIEALKAKSDG